MGLSGVAQGWGWPKRSPLPKICHTYPVKMKLGTVIPELKKTQKIYESRVLLTLAFFHRKSANFDISENTNIDCIYIAVTVSVSNNVSKSGYSKPS